jgi:hypothetical protein
LLIGPRLDGLDLSTTSSARGARKGKVSFSLAPLCKKSNMNGRQIRSVMKVSESLAKNDGRGHISVAHVKRALETAYLQEYFEGRKKVSRGNLSGLDFGQVDKSGLGWYDTNVR